MKANLARAIAVVGLGVALIGGAGISDQAAATGTPVAIEETYAPVIDPANFGPVIDNPYFPLTPGTVLYYEGESDGEAETEVVTVLSETKVVMGVTCTVVRDVVSVEGEVAEDTLDWYAQDTDGNVWYMGEESKDIEDGEVVSTDGSWEAGVDGALPGIIMLADPQAGDTYRQEFYAGEAEDVGSVLKLGETVTVESGTYEDVLVTEDTNPLEPDIVEHKYYAPGVGVVLEELVAGGEERIELVKVETGMATPEATPGY
jgi:hypothetical protein